MAFRASHFAAFGLPLIGMLALGALASDQFEGLREFTFDAYQRLRPRQWSPDSPVRIVDIDEESIAKFGQWPWPRSRLADIVKIATADGAATIGFDMVFSEPDRLSPDAFMRDLKPDTRASAQRELPGVGDYDSDFAQAISHSTVVLGAIFTNTGAPPALTVKPGFAFAGDDPAPFLPTFRSGAAPLPKLAEPAAGVGALNWLPGRDQVVREAPLLVRMGDKIVPSLAAEALRTAQGASTIVVRSSNASGQTSFGAQTGVNAVKIGDYVLATGPHAERRIYYSKSERGRFLPAWKLLDGQIPREEIDGRILLVGASAAGVLDQRATPLDPLVPGVEVHAQLIEHALAGGDLVRPDWAPSAELLVALAFALAASLAAAVLSPFAGALVAIAAVLSVCGVGWRAFSGYGVLIDPLYPTATIVVSYLAGVIDLFRIERSQKAQVKSAFGRFVSPAVVERLAASPDRLTLGGEARVITLMFSDLRDFTRLSEGMNANEIIAFMNDYLTPMSDLVLASGGTIDKYIGDAIMAFWNAPLDDPDHARSACRTALAMREALVAFNASRGALGGDEARSRPAVRFGIGLNTGLCSVGNLGSVRRFDYSAIGDPVNIASRLESLTKFYRFDIMATEETQKAAKDFAWLEFDQVRVKGRENATRLYGLIGDAAMAASPEFAALRMRHDDMLAAYASRRFFEASAQAGELAGAYPKVASYYRRYAVLCEEADLTPPREWSAIRTMLEK
ncbi:MAG: adenylate/guanylate cyclase domain-containing protein [Hyphomicrobiales bacterium]|nr:adenylate/guanylate cyclase domain-containing protein [Hyphomicrobiales bacterium]